MNLELGSLLYLFLVIPLSVVSDALRDRWRSAYLIFTTFRNYQSYRASPLNCFITEFRYPELMFRLYFLCYIWNYLSSRPWVWWRWHLIKWLNLYVPHAFIIYLLWPNLRWYEVALITALMYFVWKRIYNYQGV